MPANQSQMRLVALSPMHTGDQDVKAIKKIFHNFVQQEQAKGDQSRLLGVDINVGDDQGTIALMFGQSVDDQRDLAQTIIDIIHRQSRDYSDTILADEMIADVQPNGTYTFLNDVQLFPKDERPASQRPTGSFGALGDPAGVGASVSKAFGSQFATDNPVQSQALASQPDIASIAHKGQSMYQAPTQTASTAPASQPSSAAGSAQQVSQSAAQSQVAPTQSATDQSAEQNQLIDEIMPDADAIINTAMNPSLDVTATTQNEIMMKSQFEANLNNIYVNSMDDLSKLQMNRDKLVSELSQFKHQIMASSPKSLEQYNNVKRLVDQARQQHQEERKKVANAYDENLDKLLQAKVEKFKEMYRQQYPDDTEEKLAAFDRAFKPIEDQYDQQLTHAKELARQGLINQFMMEHQSDPVLRAAFRFMSAKNNMESQYTANQAALEKMQPQTPVYQQPAQQTPANRLTQAAAQAQQQPQAPQADLSAVTDPFAVGSSIPAVTPTQSAAPQPAETEQVPDLPDDDDNNADFDVLDAVNNDIDQQSAAANNATPQGHVPDDDPDFADNSGEATNFTDPEDAAKQQAAELNSDADDQQPASDVAHLRSGNTDVAFPDDDAPEKSQKVADDPDFPDDDDDVIQALDEDPFDDIDDDDKPVKSSKKHYSNRRGKQSKNKARRKAKRHSSGSFKKVALGGAVVGLLSLGGIAGASHLGLFNGGSGSTNSKSELASSGSQSQKKAPKGAIKVGSMLDVTVNGKQIRVKIVQVRSDGSAIGEATDGSRYAISAAQAKQAANAISHADKDANH